jgi:hypothetical protein
LLVLPFFANACVIFLPAARCSISAAVVTAASVIAVPIAVKKPAASSSARPTAAINRIPTDGTITATANESIADA